MGKCVEGEKSDKQSFLREFISTAGHLSFTWSDMKHRLIGRRRAKKVHTPNPNPISYPYPYPDPNLNPNPDPNPTPIYP